MPLWGLFHNMSEMELRLPIVSEIHMMVKSADVTKGAASTSSVLEAKGLASLEPDRHRGGAGALLQACLAKRLGRRRAERRMIIFLPACCRQLADVVGQRGGAGRSPRLLSESEE